jgi:hypothetical protein
MKSMFNLQEQKNGSADARKCVLCCAGILMEKSLSSIKTARYPNVYMYSAWITCSPCTYLYSD